MGRLSEIYKVWLLSKFILLYYYLYYIIYVWCNFLLSLIDQKHFTLTQVQWSMLVLVTRWRWFSETWRPGLILSMLMESRQTPLMFTSQHQVQGHKISEDREADNQDQNPKYFLLIVQLKCLSQVRLTPTPGLLQRIRDQPQSKRSALCQRTTPLLMLPRYANTHNTHTCTFPHKHTHTKAFTNWCCLSAC